MPRRLWVKTPPLNLDSLVPLPVQDIAQLQAEPVARWPSGASRPLEEGDVDEEDTPGETHGLLAVKAFFQRYRRWWLSREIAEKNIDDDCEIARLERRCDFRRMSGDAKVQAAQEYFRAHPDRSDRDLVLSSLMEARARGVSHGAKFLDCRAVLLTFNGPWGEVKDIELLPPSSVDMIDYVCERLQEHERMKQLWKEFKQTVYWPTWLGLGP